MSTADDKLAITELLYRYAELIDAGVDPHRVYRRLYEDLPFRRLQLLQRALARWEVPHRQLAGERGAAAANSPPARGEPPMLQAAPAQPDREARKRPREPKKLPQSPFVSSYAPD